MTAQMIDGKKIAGELKTQITQEVLELKKSGLNPGLATLLVGDDPASQVYVRNKRRACEEVGIASFHHELPAHADTKTVLEKIAEFNRDPRIHGILVQLPLPSQVQSDLVLSSIKPEKDADGFHPENLGRLFAAKEFRELTENIKPIPIPCTPRGIIHLILTTKISIAGKNAVVVGRSTIVGKPAASLLLAHHATVTITHSKTQNLLEYCQRADILVAAIGKTKMITGDMVKKGAVVIDVGINRSTDGKLCGDVDFESAKEKAGWITPVPGGVGPMTIAMLLKNTVQLAKNSQSLS